VNILLTIAARGGSKGFKDKNIKPLLGIPLISHTIRQAIKWGKATDIICSTDSAEIAGIAKAEGIKVPFMRRKELATDSMGKIPVLRDALTKAEEVFGKKYEVIVDLDATAPLRRIADIEGCLKMFLEKRPKTLFSVTPSHRNPYFNMVELKNDGYIKLVRQADSSNIVRRQSAPVVYDMNASIYVYERDYLLDENSATAISDKSMCYVMPELSRLDIDCEEDFKIVEFLLKEGIWKDEIQ